MSNNINHKKLESLYSFQNDIQNYLQNQLNCSDVDVDIIWDKLIEKEKVDKLISKFNPKNSWDSSLKTWLITCAKNLFIDLTRKKKNKYFEQYELVIHEVERKELLNNETEKDLKFDSKRINLVVDKINSIIDVKNRTVIKLYLIDNYFIKLNKEEYLFIKKNTSLNEKDIIHLINLKLKERSNYKTSGLNQKDISDWTGYKVGSITTIVNRIIKKYSLDEN